MKSNISILAIIIMAKNIKEKKKIEKNNIMVYYCMMALSWFTRN